jgi:two-component system phosphate regulon sensor histidine kinase PhoR
MTLIVLITAIAALLAAAISLAALYSLRKQIDSIKTGIMQFKDGRLDYRIPVPDSRKAAEPVQLLNKMAAALNERINSVTAQRNELEAVFSGMSEGVVVSDSRQQIIAINKAGASLLGVNAETSIGRGIQEIIYNPELQQLILNVLDKKQTLEKDIVIYKDGKQYLQVHGISVDTANGPRAVIVLSNMTRLHRLENLRQEFVSNVSHELKTPITSINGAVETLLDGALENPQKSRKFLEIIAKHTDRLNSLIEDLMSLSRIEQEIESRNITTEIDSINDVLTAAVAACQSKAAEKEIGISIDSDKTLTAPLNAPLLEQAVINLVDNAIKYSDPKTHIRIKAQRINDEVTISVADEGYGIAPEHLPRIFERFYVADKARSRKLGGTGLGLAIVKHIVSAHGGSIAVESEPGKGSTFIVKLPAK